MKYIVIYQTNVKGIVSRIGPLSSLKEAMAMKNKVHSSRRPIISEERKTLPDTASTPAPEFFRYILYKELWVHKLIEKLYERFDKKSPFKSAWRKV